jgi:hypothetical protein
VHFTHQGRYRPWCADCAPDVRVLTRDGHASQHNRRGLTVRECVSPAATGRWRLAGRAGDAEHVACFDQWHVIGESQSGHCPDTWSLDHTRLPVTTGMSGRVPKQLAEKPLVRGDDDRSCGFGLCQNRRISKVHLDRSDLVSSSLQNRTEETQRKMLIDEKGDRDGRSHLRPNAIDGQGWARACSARLDARTRSLPRCPRG